MPLRSVAVPCLSKDSENFDRLLRVWSDKRFFPTKRGQNSSPMALVVVLNREEDGAAERFTAIYNSYSSLHGVFSSFSVESADLRGDADIYVRNSLVSRGRYGNKAGPNWLFFKTMRALKRLGGFTFQNEVDCFPLQSGWLDSLCDIVGRREYAWVIGSLYTGDIPVARDIQYHLNGNALYNVGDERFQEFLEEVWQRRVFGTLDIDPNLAYDCWWAAEKSRASSVIKNESWRLVSLYDQYFNSCQFLVNILHKETMIRDVVEAIRDEAVSGQDVVLLHGGAAIEQYETMLGRQEDGRSYFLSQASDNHKVERADDLDDEPGSAIIDIPAVDALLASRSTLKDMEIKGDVVIRPHAVSSLPAPISASKLETNAFTGNWHLGTDVGHVWAGPGNSTVSFRLMDRVSELEIAIDCKLADGLSESTLACQIFGAEECKVERIPGQGFLGKMKSRRGIADFSILISAEEFIKPPGDERELSFVLFSIGLRH